MTKMLTHSNTFKRIILILTFLLVCLIALTAMLYKNNAFVGSPDQNRPIDSRIPLAVLGDSDSHSYRDSYNQVSRGGEYKAHAFNWLELWARLSEHEINPGEWGVWGGRYKVAQLKNMLGLKSRSPQKLDYEYNYAISGLTCQSLLDDWPLQGKWLLNELGSNPAFWAKGMVVIKIGYNDIGKTNDLKRWKTSGFTANAPILVSECTQSIIKMSQAILAAAPGVKVVMTGMARTYNFKDEWPEKLTPSSIENIESVLSEYDAKLQEYALGSELVAYIDDHYWFNNIFGSQENNDLKSTGRFSNGIELINASGNKPVNILMQDDHTSTLYNGLWLKHMIAEINQQLSMNLALPDLDKTLELAGMTEKSKE